MHIRLFNISVNPLQAGVAIASLYSCALVGLLFLVSMTYVAEQASASQPTRTLVEFMELDWDKVGKRRFACAQLVGVTTPDPLGFAVRNFVNRGRTYPEFMGGKVTDPKTKKERFVPAHYAYSFGGTPNGRRGCIDVNSVSLTEARRALSAQDMTTENATELEVRTAGTAMIRLQQLNGGPLRQATPGVRPYPFRYEDSHRSLRQYGDHIRIARNGKYKTGHSVGFHLHELGHMIGNSRGGKYYSDYRRHMQGYGNCAISKRSLDGAGEQFAEVFAVFVAEPAALLESNYTPDACKRAFSYFKDKFFKEGSRVYDCM